MSIVCLGTIQKYIYIYIYLLLFLYIHTHTHIYIYIYIYIYIVAIAINESVRVIIRNISSRVVCKQQNYYSTSCAIVNYVYIEYKSPRKSPCYFAKFEDSRDGVTWVLFQVPRLILRAHGCKYLIVNNRADIRNVRIYVWTRHSAILQSSCALRDDSLNYMIRFASLIQGKLLYTLYQRRNSNKDEKDIKLNIFQITYR